MMYHLKTDLLMNYQISTKKEKEKNEKMKKSPTNLNPFPLIHLEVLSIILSYE
jgi:hypothetical protein